MSQSLVKSYLHIIFSTKHREPLIHMPYEEGLYNYIAGICKRMQCFPLKVGGSYDHVHILCELSKKVTIVSLLEEIKTHSSKWMKLQDDSLSGFYWQNGYGAFSVSPRDLDKVISYIASQHAHHREKNFQQEYRTILTSFHVEYDEKYVWD